MKKISVIIPVYKVEKFLEESVSSITSQEYKDLEIILVDDGSPDSCPKICDDLKKKDSRIIVIHKENGGVSSARNKGLDMATGDYVTFVDSDDTILTNFSKVCKYLNNCNSDIVIVPFKDVKVEEGVFELTSQNFGSLINNSDVSISSTWSKFFKRENIENLRFIQGVTVAEDKEFVIRYLTKCSNYSVINLPFYDYRDNPESVMNDKTFKLTKKLFDSTKIIWNEVQKYDVDEKLKEDIYDVFSVNLYAAFRHYGSYNKEDKKKVVTIVKENIDMFKYAKAKDKKLVYFTMRVFGVTFALKLLAFLRKLKIIK